MRLVGFAETVAEGVAWIVLPWAANGNLREFVRSEPWDLPERASLVRVTFVLPLFQLAILKNK